MKKILIAAFALATFPAFAADIPTKAPPAPVTFQYPMTNGMLFEVWTGGGGGPVNATVPGIPPASLTSTTAGVGITAGWMFTPRNSPVSISLEGDVSAQNFNGNNAGFSVQGPLALEQRVMFWTSADNIKTIFAALPTLPNIFSQISAFTPPTGFVATGKNLLGAGLFVRETDISTAYQGVQAGKVWRGNLGLSIFAVQPQTSGGAFREGVEFGFNNAAKVFGQVPAGQTAMTWGPDIRARVGYAF